MVTVRRSLHMPVRLTLIVAVLTTVAAGFALHAPVASAQPSSELQFLCVSRSGVLNWSATSECPSRTVQIDIVNDGPVTTCAIPYVRWLRAPINDSECRPSEQTVVLGDASPDALCVSLLTRHLRPDTGNGCYRFEFPVTAQGRIEAACEDCYKLINILDEPSSQGYTTSEIVIEDPLNGQVTDVNVTIDISHSYSSDLRLFLRAPDGTNILLIDQLCDDSDSIEVTLDDEAATPVSDAACPLSGTYSPAPDALAAFDGGSASGVWTLIAVDIFLEDDGAINDWSLDIATTQGSLPTQGCTDCPVTLSENGVGMGTDTSTATVNAANAGTITDVDVMLDLSGGWTGQFMSISLISPSGTEVLLYDGECILFNMADLEIVYDDEAAAPLADTDCPVSGFKSFQPSSAALASLTGEDPNGIWTLAITTSIDFSAILWDWSLQIKTE